MSDLIEPRTSWQVAEKLLSSPETRRKYIALARSRYGILAEEAKDLLQDTAFDLLRHVSQVRQPESYVAAIFRAKCARHIAMKIRARGLFDDGAPPDLPAEGVSERVELALAVREGFRTMSARCRKLLSAYYLRDLSLRETAYHSSVSPASAPKLLSRCLRRLRECLG